MHMGKHIIFFGAILLMAGCWNSDLRGTWSKSNDGNTYLVVAENNCKKCPLIVDGKPWNHPVGEAGRIDPGHHKIGENGGEIWFDVPSGRVYRFNYWGP